MLVHFFPSNPTADSDCTLDPSNSHFGPRAQGKCAEYADGAIERPLSATRWASVHADLIACNSATVPGLVMLPQGGSCEAVGRSWTIPCTRPTSIARVLRLARSAARLKCSWSRITRANGARSAFPLQPILMHTFVRRRVALFYNLVRRQGGSHGAPGRQNYGLLSSPH